MIMTVQKLHDKLLKAGLPVASVSDSKIEYERQLTQAETDLAKTIVASFDPNALDDIEIQENFIKDSVTGFRNIPDWATWTPQQASDFIAAQIFSGQTKEQIEAWIDTNVTTLATAKVALKNIADEVISIRADLAKMAQMMMLIRNVVITKK